MLGSGLCGKAAADAVRRRARTLEGLTEGIRVLRIHMMGLLEPVQFALERSECPLLALVAAGVKDGRSAHEAWGELRGRTARRGGPVDALVEEDLQLLDRLFQRLGQSGREEQEALLSATLQSLELRLASARQKAGEADRLYLSLGLLIGLMLALIVM